jgi:aminoglycoside phosphotransferase (APT) family kinase protein
VELSDRALVEVGRLTGGPVTATSTLVDHHERCVLDVLLADRRRAVVKADRDVARARREVRVLQAAAAAGVPVPAVLADGEQTGAGRGEARRDPAGSSGWVVLLEHVGGEWLSTDLGAPAWRAAGRAMRGLHGTAVPGLRQMADQADWASGLEWVLEYWRPTCLSLGLGADALGSLADAVRALALRTPEDLPTATLHGDCMPIHVHVDERGEVVGLLDLGEAGLGDPAWDITVLSLRSPERLPAVLDGYGADDRLRRWVAEAFAPYGALRLTLETGWLATHGFDPADTLRAAHRAIVRLTGS